MRKAGTTQSRIGALINAPQTRIVHRGMTTLTGRRPPRTSISTFVTHPYIKTGQGNRKKNRREGSVPDALGYQWITAISGESEVFWFPHPSRDIALFVKDPPDVNVILTFNIENQIRIALQWH